MTALHRLTLTAAAIALVLTAALALTAQPTQAQDNRPSVQFAEVTYVIQENDTGRLNIGVTITPALSTASRVKIVFSGTATRNVDYAVGGVHRVFSGPYSWSSYTEYVDLPAGATRVNLPIGATQDRFTENNESAVLQIESIDPANAPYKIGNPQGTEVVILDNSVGPNPDTSGVSGGLSWTATLTVKNVSHDLERSSNPMVVRKKKDAGQYIACTDNSGLEANESCTHGFVYERVALSEVTGTTSFPMVGCRNNFENGKQCYSPHALTDNGFVHGGVAYRITAVTLSGGTLILGFDRPLSEDLKSTLQLTVGGSTMLRLADAEGGGAAYHWENTGLSWTTDPAESVSLRLEQVQQQQADPQFYERTPDGDGEPQLQIAEVEPGMVGELQVTTTATTATVRWTAPERGGEASRYIAHIRPDGEGKGKTTKRPDAPKTYTTFKNLTPGATYKVWVRAQNDAGKGLRRHITITLPSE